jgi:hypothetical protein
MKQFLLSFFALTFLAMATQARSTETGDTSEARDQAAKGMVENHPNYLAIHTKGLVCSSCGIGLRIHASKLEGVDKSQLNKGVDLDVKKQLVLVAFKPGAVIDVDGVREAIYNAGFDPVHYYIWTEMGGITQTAYHASGK